MFEKLSLAGAELLKMTLPDLLGGRIQAVQQNDAEAVYSPNIQREDERIDWTRSSWEIYNQVRGLNPFPVAFTLWNGEVLKIWSCANPRQEGSATRSRQADRQGKVPGTVLQVKEYGIEVLTGDGTLWITELQPSGRKAMSVDVFVRGGQMSENTVLGLEVTASEI